MVSMMEAVLEEENVRNTVNCACLMVPLVGRHHLNALFVLKEEENLCKSDKI